MKLNKITISYFKSFGENVALKLDELSNNLLVIGRNQDCPGMDSNESGKSNLFDAIRWCIFGTFPGMPSADSVVNKNAEQCRVNCDFGNMVIERGRGKKNYIKLFVSGEEHEYKTDTITQEEIFKCFNLNIIPKIANNDFDSRAYFSPFVLKSFASAGATSSDRISLIMRFLGLDKVEKSIPIFKQNKSELRKKLKVNDDDVKELKVNLKEKLIRKDTTENDIKLLNVKLDEMNDKIKDGEKRRDLENEISKIRMEFDYKKTAYSDKRDTLRKEYDEVCDQISNGNLLKVELEKMDEEYDKLREMKLGSSKESHESAIERASQKIRDLENKLSDYNNQLMGLEIDGQVCPECNTDLMVGDDGSIQQYDKETVEHRIEFVKGKMQELNSKIESHIVQKNKFMDQLTVVNQKIADFQEWNLEYSNLKQKVESLDLLVDRKEKINKQGKSGKQEFKQVDIAFQQQIIELNARLKVIPEISKDIMSEIAEMNSDLNQVSRLHGSIIAECDHLELRISQVIDIDARNKIINDKIAFEDQAIDLIDRGVKASINQFLPVFELTVNKYLDMFESGLQFKPEIDSASIRDSFKIWIDDGSEQFLIDERSRGAQTRIAISVGFALIELAGNPIGFLMADEIVDSLDAVGIDLFFNLLNSDELKDTQKLIISHDSSLKNYFDDVITVVKENEITRIAV
jgi:DNA repair exonuclease SbcCD ATPase subunit